jgi:serine/threonine protein kinase
MLAVTNHGEGLPDPYDFRRKSGRWKYQGKLGEGGLGVVHRARDSKGKLVGDIAIKVCKLAKDVKATAKLRSAFILHREAQWSLQWIHNSEHKSYSKQKAALFAKYLEDHTGRWSRDCDFDEERVTFESAEFRWDKFKPMETMPEFPYVAMEYVPGRTLHSALGWSRDQPTDEHLNQEEKESIVKQATQALIYLMDMGLIHRDFRTTNLMVSYRKADIQVRVIDLGHTILAEEHQCRNKSAVVRCNWKEDEKRKFDWAPPEVKAKEPFMNFSYPVHSFDIFSFGVLAVPR